MAAAQWQPSVSFGMLREMARHFGAVVSRTRRDKIRWGLRFRIEGAEYYSWVVPVHTRWIPYVTQEMASGVLEEIRSDLRRGMDPLAAVSPYIRNSKIDTFGKFWDEWIKHQKRRVSIGELSKKYVTVVSRYGGYLAPIWNVSVFALDFAHMESLKLHLLDRIGPQSALHVLKSVRACSTHWSRRRGMPPPLEIPGILVPPHTPGIPSLVEQRRLLAAIPEAIRGYWLARGLLGVRDDWLYIVREGRRGVQEFGPIRAAVACSWAGLQQLRAALRPERDERHRR